MSERSPSLHVPCNCLLSIATTLVLLGCSQAEPSTTQRGASPTAVSSTVAGQPAPPPPPNPVLDSSAVPDQPTLLVPAPPTVETPINAAATDVCKSTSAHAERPPVDVVMMVDQSLSMVAIDAAGFTRWENVINALTQFVQAPESAGLNIGVQYFGLGVAGGSCEPVDYATTEVEIGPLPENAAALTASFAAHAPSTVTPTAPALQGAIMHARSHKEKNPEHTVIALLVTDGEPDACGALPETIAAAAEGFAGSVPVTTYVLGVGESLDALHQIAAAGGSDQAYIVDAMQDVSAQVVAALGAIRGSASLPCEYLIPPPDPGSTFELDKVNLTFTPGGGESMIIGHAPDLAVCNQAPLAWRYDNPDAPTKFILCENTCQTIGRTGGSVDIAFKCPTIELK